MKNSFSLFILLFIVSLFFSPVKAKDIDDLKKKYTKKEVMIPMRDGIRLFTTIYEPREKSSAHSILIRRTPYSCSPYGVEFNGTLLREWKKYTDNNYIIVIQDVRGRHRSEGTFIQLRPLNKKKEISGKSILSRCYYTIQGAIQENAGRKSQKEKQIMLLRDKHNI